MDYLFGRLVLSFLGLVAIIIMIAGGVIAVSGAGIGFNVPRSYAVGIPSAYLASIPGIAIALLGVILMACVDHMSATLDTATATKKMLRVAEEQLKVSREAIRLGKETNTTLAAAAGVPVPSIPEPAPADKRTGLFGFLRRKPAQVEDTATKGSEGKVDPALVASATAAPEHDPIAIDEQRSTLDNSLFQTHEAPVHEGDGAPSRTSLFSTKPPLPR